MSNYDSYTRGQLIQKIESLETENKFLKEYIRGTKEFKDIEKFQRSEDE